MKRPDGVTVVAIWYWVNAFFFLLGGCAILTFAIAPIALAPGDTGGRAIAILAVSIGLLFVLAFGVVGAIAGWGLYQLKEWGRWMAIVLAILSLFGVPLGTLVGAIIIWYLLQPQVAIAFGAGVPVVPSAPGGPFTAPIPVVSPAPPAPPSEPSAPPAE
ncbi:MAG: hypothetical protein ACM3JD_13205 [Rudaea sp.]